MAGSKITNRLHENLEVWRDAMDMVVDVYRLTKQFPSNERFELVSQMQRSAVSIHSNIAEGAGRDGRRDFLRFLSIARGSLTELETQIQIAARLGYVEDPKLLLRAANKVFSKMTALINSIKAKLYEPV